VVFLRRGSPATFQQPNESSLRASSSSRALTNRTSPISRNRSAPLVGFCSLQHMKNRRSTCRGLCLPATFRLQGLATLLTASSLRFRAGFVSHRQRSWDSPFGAFPSRKVFGALPPRKHPHTVSPAVAPAGDPTGRPGRPRFLGFGPFESPWHPDVCLARRLLDAPLGFTLLGFFTKA
jgi:hypothetical protein